MRLCESSLVADIAIHTSLLKYAFPLLVCVLQKIPESDSRERACLKLLNSSLSNNLIYSLDLVIF